MRRLAAAAGGLVITIGLGGLALGALASAGPSPPSLIKARIDERTVRFSPALHAGFVQLHIVSTGIEPHHLLFWQLNRGVSFKQFDRVDASQTGNPFALATLVGGNGQLAPGHSMDIWIHVAKGRIAIDDIPAGRGPGFHRDLLIRSAGQSATQPKALGTVIAPLGDHYRLPPGFGHPGVWKFANQDNKPQEAGIVQLAPGKTVADVVSWAKRRKKGPPPQTAASAPSEATPTPGSRSATCHAATTRSSPSSREPTVCPKWRWAWPQVSPCHDLPKFARSKRQPAPQARSVSAPAAAAEVSGSVYTGTHATRRLKTTV